jgi:hypothetical protein
MGRTQNNKGTYALSDLPMPRGYPEWPTGAQVQAYLESYVDKFGLGPSLRLGTEVTYATPVEDGWEVTAGPTTAIFDHLVVANGIFSDPVIPPFDGVDVFESAGGRLLAACDFHDLAGARGKHVVVVGYGKTSCDVSREISKVAASTTVVARELLWKMPKRLNGVVNYKYVMLTNGRGTLPVPDPCRSREVPAGQGRRCTPPHAQQRRVGRHQTPPPARARPRPRRNLRGHRQKHRQSRHRRFLRGDRRRTHLGAERPHDPRWKATRGGI